MNVFPGCIVALRMAVATIATAIAVEAAAQTTITIVPAAPTTESAIQVDVSDFYPNCPVVLGRAGPLLVGSEYRVAMDVDILFAATPCTIASTFLSGNLPQGTYSVRYLVTVSSIELSLRDVSQPFVVSGAAGAVQSIPLSGPWTNSLLVLGIVAGAFLFNRRNRSGSNLTILMLTSACALLAGVSVSQSTYALNGSELPAPRSSATELVVLFDSTVAGLDTNDVLDDFVARSGPSVQLLGSARSVKRVIGGRESELDRSHAQRFPRSPDVLLGKYVIAEYSDEKALDEAIARIRVDKRVLWVSRVFYAEPSTIPDPFALPVPRPTEGRWQWGLETLNLPSAWDLSRGRANLGVIDSGISLTNPDLQIFNPALSLDGNFRKHISRDASDGASDLQLTCPPA